MVCADPRCATLLEPDAEICDECGGSNLRRLEDVWVRLCGWSDDRAVVFALDEPHAFIIGRSTVAGGPVPDIDLRRFPGSSFVHRRHARLERAVDDDASWQVTQLATTQRLVL